MVQHVMNDYNNFHKQKNNAIIYYKEKKSIFYGFKEYIGGHKDV